MKKILIICSVCGFLAKFEKEDVGLLQELGYEVHYASNSGNPIYQYNKELYKEMGIIFHEIAIQRSPFQILQNKKAIKQVQEIIKAENINVVHCHTPSGGLVARLACRNDRNRKIYMIYTTHGFHFYKGCSFWRYPIFYAIENLLSHFTDVIITINSEDYQAALNMHARKAVYRIPGVGLDMEYFYKTTLKERNTVREQLKLQDKFFLISVGELRKNKNHRVVLQALGILKNNGLDISRICYGLLGIGNQENELRKQAQELGLESNVIFYGYRQDVRPYLQAADVFVFPSIREGLGMAALEALATGLPVIASDNRGTREYMCSKRNGYICSRNTAEEYAKYIYKLYQGRQDWSENFKRRDSIRKSVIRFEKSASADIMRRVYQDAAD